MTVSTEARRLTNEEVAVRLGLTHSAVSRIRTGHRISGSDVLVRISEEFGVDLATLTRAAADAKSGNRAKWVELLESAFVEA